MNEFEKSFGTILEHSEKKDCMAEITELRYAFAQSREYSPYNDSSVILYRGKMMTALEQKDYFSAIDYARKALQINFLNIEAHMVIYKAGLMSNNREVADRHRAIADAVLASVKASGDGLTPETAYKVISVQEEYMVLDSLGTREVKHVLVNGGNGRFFDIHEVVMPGSNEKTRIYFDVSIPYSTLTKNVTRAGLTAPKQNRIIKAWEGMFKKK